MANIEITIPAQTVDVSIPVPQIVYSNSWLDQTENLASTTVFTATANGLYRVSLGGVAAPPPSGGGEVNVSITSGTTASGGSFSSAGGGTFPSVFSMFLFAGENFQISAVIGSAAIGSYNVYLTVEQIQ